MLSQAVDQLLGVPSESTSQSGAPSLGLSLSLREEQMSEVRQGYISAYRTIRADDRFDLYIPPLGIPSVRLWKRLSRPLRWFKDA